MRQTLIVGHSGTVWDLTNPASTVKLDPTAATGGIHTPDIVGYRLIEGDGRIVTRVAWPERVLQIPLLVEASTPLAVDEQIEAFCADVSPHLGEVKLRSLRHGESGTQGRYLLGHVTGLRTVEPDAATPLTARLPGVTFTANDPWWWTQTSGRKTVNLALGTTAFTVSGTAPTWPVEVRLSVASAGVGTIVVTHQPSGSVTTVIDSAGDPLHIVSMDPRAASTSPESAAGSEYFRLDPAESTSITLAVTGTTSITSASVTYDERWFAR